MGIVATTVAGLDAARYDGDIRIIRIGVWPDVEEVVLFWQAAQSRWVAGEVIPLVDGNDLNWLIVQKAGGGPATFWSYLGYAANSILPQACTNLRAVRRAGEFYTAGLKLQDRQSCRCQVIAGTTMDLVAHWYQFNENDDVVFSNDNLAGDFRPSPESIGRGTIISHTGATIKYQETGWTDIAFFQVNSDGTMSSTPVTPSKKYLLPWYYGQNVTDGTGRVAGLNYEVRWVSA